MISFKELKENFKKNVKFLKVLTSDKRVPGISKVLLSFCIVYLVSPIDIMPDFIPILGQLDDLIIIPAVAFIALKLIPRAVYEENHRKVFG